MNRKKYITVNIYIWPVREQTYLHLFSSLIRLAVVLKYGNIENIDFIEAIQSFFTCLLLICHQLFYSDRLIKTNLSSLELRNL